MTKIIFQFSPKRTTEVVALTIDFVNVLGTTEVISTNPAWTATVVKGIDASPGNIISGAATKSGSKVTQKIKDGVSGVTYCLLAKVTTDAGQTIEEQAQIKVSDACS